MAVLYTVGGVAQVCAVTLPSTRTWTGKLSGSELLNIHSCSLLTAYGVSHFSLPSQLPSPPYPMATSLSEQWKNQGVDSVWFG